MTNGTARPQLSARGSGMTMHVYTVDRYGTVVQDRGTVTVVIGDGPPPLTLNTAFPPCACPRHRSGPAVGSGTAR
ncbi:hypothetical protein [Streptomyces sp. SudanB182_2057]|uniref:hypothetical protein n=1 Tax=Streptomyces sp. SudanB182_2057 TaxID=3035281 RepID=UPI003F56E9BB